MADIRALGYLPRMTQGLGDEYALASDLRNAKVRGLLSESQLVELEQMPGSNPRDASQLAAERTETLMEEIGALGHLPRGTKGLGNEYALAFRLRYAKASGQLSESQLAELADIARSSDEPVRKRPRMLGV